MNKRLMSDVGRVALLAAPFVLISLWLGLAVAPFGLGGLVPGVGYGLALAVGVLLLGRSLGGIGVVLGMVLYVASLLLCVADGVSWFMQGSSFNERFFAHADLGNFRVSMAAYTWAFIGVMACLVAIIVAAAFILSRSARHRLKWWAVLPGLLLVAVALTLNAPPRRLYAYFSSAEHISGLVSSAAGGRILAMLDTHPTPPDQVIATPGRNLVFVYLESLERTYTDDHRFPGLTPNIDRLRQHGLDFSGFWTFPGVTYTIAGIFSSQCGAPYLINTIFGGDFGELGFVPNNDNTTASSFHPELACLGDVLHAAGYDQTYLSGVSLQFANTGQFFRMHHYDHVLGRPEIEKLHDGKLPVEGWGLLDTGLFHEALADYRRKEASGKPFSIVMSTIDTHPPDGYVLAGCTPYTAIHNPMLDAVHCADQMLGRFIDELSREPGWSNTVVVVMSDHISMRNVASPLYPPVDQRQPLLFVLDAGRGERPAHMYHMDIAPTVLSLMGVHSNVRFMAGADRSKPGSPGNKLPANAVAKAVLREELWKGHQPPVLCDNHTLVSWNGDGLDLGGWKLPLMAGGYPVRRIPDGRTLLIFVNGQRAQLQVLSHGEQARWVQRARKAGNGIFEATPFRDGQGHAALALDWLAPNGSWASLGQVPDVEAIHLRSRQCQALLGKLAAEPQATRLDFSKAFATRQIPAARERHPGYVMSARLPPDALPGATSAFMFARLVKEHPGYGTVHINVNNRIVVMPHRSDDGWAEFDVSGLTSLQLVPRVDRLYGTCATRKDTGNVGVRLWLDGRLLMPRFLVDRDYDRTLQVTVDGAHRLRVDVDNGNGSSTCDHFALGFVDLATPSPDHAPSLDSIQRVP